jgi:hypothetical protein
LPSRHLAVEHVKESGQENNDCAGAEIAHRKAGGGTKIHQ